MSKLYFRGRSTLWQGVTIVTKDNLEHLLSSISRDWNNNKIPHMQDERQNSNKITALLAVEWLVIKATNEIWSAYNKAIMNNHCINNVTTVPPVWADNQWAYSWA